jgi:hypothetical protein
LRNLFLAVLVSLCATAAQAAIITYDFTGTVLFGDGGASSPLTGSFSYDTATPGVIGHYPVGGLISFSVGSEIGLTGLLDHINISNGESLLGDPDFLTIGSLAPAITVPFFQGASLYMEFIDPEPSTLSLLATAASMLAFAAWRRASRVGPVAARGQSK